MALLKAHGRELIRIRTRSREWSFRADGTILSKGQRTSSTAWFLVRDPLDFAAFIRELEGQCTT